MMNGTLPDGQLYGLLFLLYLLSYLIRKNANLGSGRDNRRSFVGQLSLKALRRGIDHVYVLFIV